MTAGDDSHFGTSAPPASTTVVTTIASTTFIIGPARYTWNRTHLLFDRNSSGAPTRSS